MRMNRFFACIVTALFCLMLFACNGGGSQETYAEPQNLQADGNNTVVTDNNSPDTSPAITEQGRCTTRYPVVLVHGLGWKDLGFIEYFNGIPAALKKEKANVYVANQLSFGGQSQAAESLVKIVSEILAATGSHKVNLLGQSQAGPIMRYFTANCKVPVAWSMEPVNASEVVGSVTSIGCPNKGTAVCDAIVGLLPPGTVRNDQVEKIINIGAGYLWDEDKGDTDCERAFIETSVKYMTEVFNKELPLVGPENGGYKDGVYYQSFAGELNGPTINFWLFGPAGALVSSVEGGKNDGFVSVESAKLGNYRGIIKGAWWIGGVDHAYQINHIMGITPGFDAKAFYVNLLEELKKKGF